MKQITTLLLTILALSCNAQEPRLMYSVESVIDINEVSVIADTFNFEIVDDRIKVEINKVGHNVQIDLVDQDTIIHVTYIDYIRNVILSE